MTIRKGLLEITAALTIAGLGLWVSGQTANADPIASTTYNTGAKALLDAPQGVFLGSGTKSNYFTIDNTVSTASGSNAAKLIAAGNTGGSSNSAIQISKAGTTQSWGSIWSSDQSFDLSKKETASMWIYASAEGNASASTSAGDGMAFVLQNGGTNVYSGSGESMGVWGVPDSLFAQTNVASTAIQNSWALEFDTFPNGSIPTQPTYDDLDFFEIGPKTNPTWNFTNQQPTSFDVNGETPSGQSPIADTHIASNYPGSSDTYVETSDYAKGQKKMPMGSVQDYQGDFYYYSMRHLGYLDEGPTGTSGNLSDQRWHHITVDYTPPTTAGGKGSMTYTYNDKNPDTGMPVASSDYATVPIDLSKFNLASGQTKVRWGFTGSTGAASENNYVIFDQLPGQAQTEATAKLSYLNNNFGDYEDVNDGGSIPGNSTVKLTYNFGRTDGDEDWKSVNANLYVPKDLTITKGTIDYPDGTSGTVDTSAIGSAPGGQSQVLKVPLAGSGLTMSGTQHATITLTGTANNVATSTTGVTEAAQTSYFTGTNASSSAKLPSFKITSKVNADLLMDTFKDKGVLKVNYGGADDAHVIGTALPHDINAVKAKDIVVHPAINGVSQDAVTMESMPSSDPTLGNSPYYFDYDVPNSKLQPGNNTISFYATYGSGDTKITSTTVNATVVAGTVGFGHTSGDMTFEPTTLTGSGSVLIKRDSDWSLDVDDNQINTQKDTEDTEDTEDKGDAAPWSVTARTDGMYTTGTAVKTKLDGELIYVDAKGIRHHLDGSDNPVIASGSASKDGTELTTNIAKDWTDQSGIMLRVNSGAVQGVYSGEITWSFINSVDTGSTSTPTS
ncbi:MULTISPECIES: hypothetical protein [Lactobacillaceae]|uniref:hypothetical protein n=1 Tax=Lactobacillaceae TaxID=33958 RepID=UPI001456DDD0|nr:hypothetical protein [Lactobacillus sp. HBUAS51381]NLR08919.1 hypothetical protein [Lactobacillus sp. HBUAS51381]